MTTNSDRLHAIQRAAIPVALAAAIVVFAAVVGRHERFADWLFFRYAGYGALSLLFAAACFSSGHVVVLWIRGGRVLPLFEHVAVSFAAGLYVFFLGSMLGGLLGLYGSAFFVALPLALVASGGRRAVRYVRRAARHLGGAWRRSRRPPPWALAVHAFGLLGLALIYFAILTPDNTAFDARWYHLGIAEQYTAQGVVRRFPEGWFHGAEPQLASFLYAWAFLLPRGSLFDRIELAAHLEFTIFAIALIGIPAIVRLVVRPAVARGLYRYAWVVRLLFPGVLLYDSSLSLGADHVAAAFAAPIFVLLVRAWRDLAPRDCAILALAIAGAVLTKYSAGLILAVPAILAVVGRAVARALGEARGPRSSERLRAVWAGPLAALAAGVVLTSPHWLKNALWYGDPVYPVLHRFFHPRPWTADTSARFDIGYAATMWPAEHSLRGVAETLAALFTFSLTPHDFEPFHGETPVFGSLFSLTLLALPLLRPSRRLWGLYAIAHAGVLIWFWVHHLDRYLQAAMPWMAAGTAAALGLAWRAGRAARVGVGVLVALQIVWGADVYFMPGHAFVGVPARTSIDLLSHRSGEATRDRWVFHDNLVAVGRALPPASKLLIHEFHPRLGLEAAAVTDCPYHQGGISYRETPTPREVYDQLSGFGVTHLAYRAGQAREPDTLAGEIVFANFVTRYTGPPRAIEGWWLAAMPGRAPEPGHAPDPVLVLTCGRGLAPGLYRLADSRAARARGATRGASPARARGSGRSRPRAGGDGRGAGLIVPDPARAACRLLEGRGRERSVRNLGSLRDRAPVATSRIDSASDAGSMGSLPAPPLLRGGHPVLERLRARGARRADRVPPRPGGMLVERPAASPELGPSLRGICGRDGLRLLQAAAARGLEAGPQDVEIGDVVHGLQSLARTDLVSAATGK